MGKYPTDLYIYNWEEWERICHRAKKDPLLTSEITAEFEGGDGFTIEYAIKTKKEE